MIHYVEGDILLSKAQATAHGVAANDPMDQGLAKSLHEHYPAMHKDYHHWCHISHPKPGEAWMWGCADGKFIVNLITQEGGYSADRRPGKASTSNVNHALRALKKIVAKEGFSSIALPRLATGVGGMNWEDIDKLIQNQLSDLDIPVFVYQRFVAGQTAKEQF